MKIITQNLHCFEEVNFTEKWTEFAKYIFKEDIDIIFLQEVAQTSSAKKLEGTNCKEDNSALFIQNQLKKMGVEYYVEFSPAHIGYTHYDEGLAILSKRSIEEVETITVSERDDFTEITRRIAMKCVVGGKQLVNVHLGIKAPELGVINSPAFKEFERLTNVIQGDIIVFGDFNIVEMSDEYKKILGLGFEDLFVKQSGLLSHTTPGKISGWENVKTPQKLDHVFTNHTIKVNAAKVIFDDIDAPAISDHYGIYIELDLN